MANFIEKLLDVIKLSDDDYDDDYDDEFDDDDFKDEPKRPVKEKKAKASEAAEEEPVTREKGFSRPKVVSSGNNVVPMRSMSKSGMEVCMIKPTSVDDGREIADTLLSGRAVVINLEGIHVEVAQRIIDFTSGSTYSISGNLQKISNYIFIATPPSINLSGDFSELLGNAKEFDISALNLNL